MNHFLDIFKQKDNIIKAYLSCVIGNNRHLLESFSGEVNDAINAVNNELDYFRQNDQGLYDIGRNIIIPMMQLYNSLPMILTDEPENKCCIKTKIAKEATNTFAMLEKLKKTDWKL